MPDDELKEYAEKLIRDHAQDIEWLTIEECWEGDEDLSPADQDRVYELIHTAKVEVTIQ